MELVTIVGAGPAGLFSAYELAKHGLKPLVIERGKRPLERSRKEMLYGVGGAGLFSDGKLNLSPFIGGDLTEFTTLEEANSIIEEIKDVFLKHGVQAQMFFDEERMKEIERKARAHGIRYVPVKQMHIGSDVLPKVMDSFMRELESMGVRFKLGKSVKVIRERKGFYEVDGIKTKFLLVAPGRAGVSWLYKNAKRLGLSFKHNPIDVGVRVEVPASVMEHITSVSWDPKFHIYTRTYDDFVRTFCVNPYGFVVDEHYKSFVLVNGHAMKSKTTENTNFALLVRIGLEEPVENTTAYGEQIARLATTLGGGKVLLQRLGDLRRGRRSTWSRIKRSFVEPSFRNVTPGDISMALPHRVVEDIMEAIEMLDRIMPGVAADSTLLYCPEIKFYALRIITDHSLKAKPRFYVAGDGAGVSRGIVAAAATGIIAARGMLKEMEG